MNAVEATYAMTNGHIVKDQFGIQYRYNHDGGYIEELVKRNDTNEFVWYPFRPFPEDIPEFIMCEFEIFE